MTWTDSRLLYGGTGLAFGLGLIGFSVALGSLSGPSIALAGAVAALWVTGNMLLKAARGLTAVSSDDEQVEAQAAVGRRRRELTREYHLLKRALKELELDRSMGKLSDDDYAEIRSRYRERAVRILRQLDQGQSYEQQIERDLSARREALGKNGTGVQSRAGDSRVDSQACPQQPGSDGHRNRLRGLRHSQRRRCSVL